MTEEPPSTDPSKNPEIVETSIVPSQAHQKRLESDEIIGLVRATASFLRQADPGKENRAFETLQSQLRLWIFASLLLTLAALLGWWLYTTNHTEFEGKLALADSRVMDLNLVAIELKTQLEASSRENAKLEGQYSIMRERQNNAQNTVEVLRSSKANLEQKQHSLETQIGELISQQAKTQQDLANSHAMIGNAETKLQGYQSTLEEHSLDIQQAEDKIKQQRQLLDSSFVKQSELQAALNKSTFIADQLRSRLDQSESNAKEAKSQLSLTRQLLDKTKSDLQKEAEGRLRLEGLLDHTLDQQKELPTNAPPSDEPRSFSLGIYYRDRGSYEAAANEFKKTLVSNPLHFESMMNLGQQYLLGRGVEKSLEKAFQLYKQVADQSNNELTGDAQYIVGIYYLRGTGTKPSKSKARYYLRLAMEKGHPRAQIALSALESESATPSPN